MKLKEEIELLNALENIDPAEGLKLIEENEGLIRKKYYDIYKYKISFLIATRNFIDAKILISNELSVPYIPKEFEEYLKDALKICNFELNTKASINPLELLEKLSTLDDDTFQSVLPLLKNYNLYNYIDEIQKSLLADNISNINKSLLIAVLSDNKIDVNLKVSKDNKLYEFNPITLQDIRDNKSFNNLLNKIEKIENIDKNYQDTISYYMQLYFLDIYPLLEVNEDNLLTACIYKTAEVYKISIIIPEYERNYLLNKKECDELISKLDSL